MPTSRIYLQGRSFVASYLWLNRAAYPFGSRDHPRRYNILYLVMLYLRVAYFRLGRTQHGRPLPLLEFFLQSRHRFIICFRLRSPLFKFIPVIALSMDQTSFLVSVYTPRRWTIPQAVLRRMCPIGGSRRGTPPFQSHVAFCMTGGPHQLYSVLCSLVGSR